MRLSEFMNEGIVVDGEFDTFDYCTTNRSTPFLGFLENKKYKDQILLLNLKKFLEKD